MPRIKVPFASFFRVPVLRRTPYRRRRYPRIERLEDRSLLAGGYSIVLDPGHGGTVNVGGSGANHATGVVSGIAEKDLTLDLALRMKPILEAHGYDVTLTRDADVNLSLEDRARVANATNADFFLSFHFNAHADPSARGTETWVRWQTDNVNLAPDKVFATHVQNAVVAAIPGGSVRSGSPKEAQFGVLYDGYLASANETPVVSALLEVEFITNADADRFVSTSGGLDQLARAAAEGIERARVALFQGAGIEFDAARFVSPVGEPLTFSGRALNANGQPRVGEMLVVEDGLRQMTRMIGPTDSSGRFSLGYTADETRAAGAGYYTATVLVGNGERAEPLGFTLSDTGLMTAPLGSQLALGPLETPGAVLAESRAFTPVAPDWQVPEPTPGMVRTAGMVTARAMARTIIEKRTDPTFLGALIVGGVACALPDPTLLTKALCAGLVSYALKDFAESTLFAAVHEAIDEWANRERIDPQIREDAHNIVKSSEALWSAASLKPYGGYRSIDEVLEALTAARELPHAAVELGRDALGRINEVRLVAPTANGDTLALSFATAADAPPYVVSTAPVRHTFVVSGPTEVLVRWSKTMDRSPGLLSPDDLQLAGPGVGTARVTNARWVDDRTAAFDISGAWGLGRVAFEITTPDVRDLTGKPTVDLLNAEFTIRGAVELAVEEVFAPVSATIGQNVVVPVSIRNHASQASPSTQVRYDVVAADGSSSPLATVTLPAIDAGAVFHFTPTLRIPPTMTAGLYTIRATVDPQAALPEQRRDDNVRLANRRTQFVLAASGLPDLTAEALLIAAVGTIDGSVPVTWTARNASAFAAPASEAEVVVAGSSAVSLGRIAIPAIPAGQSASQTVRLNVPPTIVPGNHVFELRLNPDQAVAEVSFGNNVIASATTIALELPDDPRPNLLPQSLVVASSTVAAGASLSVNVTVANASTSTADEYDVTFVLTANRFIDQSDRVLKTVRRSSLAPGQSDAWTESLMLPADVASGPFYVGVDIDRRREVPETNEFDNKRITPNTISVTPPLATFQLVSLGFQVSETEVFWGDRITVPNNLRNDGSGPFPGGTLEFVLSDLPTFPGSSTLVLHSRAIDVINPGRASGAYTSVPLPATRPANFAGTANYLGLRLAGQIFAWQSLSPGIRPPALAVNIVGADLDLTPDSILGWGGVLTVDVRFRNDGTQPAENFRNAIYLSANETFDASDVRVHSYLVERIVGNATLSRRELFSLPPTPPSGFAPTQNVYVLHVADDENRYQEGTGEADNSGQGYGVDFLDITLTTNPPVNGNPVVGSFTLSRNSVVRGTDIDVIADGVVDDGAVNHVHVFLDSNGNARLDPEDERISDGPFFLSRLGSRATGRLDSALLSPGTHRLMAVAEDNFGHWSAPVFATLVVQGVGTAVPDRFEANDSRTEVQFLGAGPTIVQSNLSITPGDRDWFSFAFHGDATLRIRLDFFQENGWPVAPGNLYLELYREGSESSYGFSNSSTAGTTKEEIVRTNTPSGVYHVGIAADGSGNFNNSYKLTIEMTSPAGHPTSNGVVTSDSVLRPTEQLTATMKNVVGYGAEVWDVPFYVDKNRDHWLDASSEFLGWGERVFDWQTFNYTNDFAWTGSVSDWGLGQFDVLAFPIDSVGRRGLTLGTSVAIRHNNAPTLDRLTAPHNVPDCEPILLIASGFSDPEGTPTNVRFRFDANGDGAVDTDLPGVPTVSGNEVRLTVDSHTLGVGTFVLAAIPFDGETEGDAVTTAVTVSPVPLPAVLIGDVTAPAVVNESQGVTLRATGVTAAGANAIALAAFADSNDSGQLEPDVDARLAVGTAVTTGTFDIAISPDSLQSGVTLFFVQASADGFRAAIEPVAVRIEPNQPPTDVSWTASSVAENVDARNGWVVATLAAVDSDGPRTSHSFALATGAGDDDNGLFEVVGDELRLRPGTTLDFETDPRLHVRLEVRDGDAALTRAAVIDVTDVPETLRVAGTSVEPAGVTVSFAAPLNGAVLNVYDGQDAAVDAPDVTLVGASSGRVPISMLVDADQRSVVLVPFAGRLAADSYTLRLASRADGFVSPLGDLLDGNGDGVSGDDFVHSFVIAAATAPTLRLPHVARGPGQNIDLRGSGGLPVTLTNANGTTHIAATVAFDAATLDVTDVTLAPGVPADWSLQFTRPAPDRVAVTAGGRTPLPAGDAELFVVRSRVPSSAVLGTSRPLRITDIVRNGSEPLAAALAAQVVAFFGDVTGNGSYSALDASRVARVVAGLEDGFDPFDRIDPRIIADISGNGTLSSLDAAFIARRAVGLPQPEIP